MCGTTSNINLKPKFFPELNQSADFSDCMTIMGISSISKDKAMSASSDSQIPTPSSIYKQIALLKAEHAKKQAELQAALDQFSQEEPDFDNEDEWVEI